MICSISIKQRMRAHRTGIVGVCNRKIPLISSRGGFPAGMGRSSRTPTRPSAAELLLAFAPPLKCTHAQPCFAS